MSDIISFADVQFHVWSKLTNYSGK